MVMSAKLSIIKAVYISPVRLHNNFVYKIISLHMKTGLACLAGTGSLVSHFQDSNRVPGQPIVHDVNWIPFPSKLFPVFACEYFYFFLFYLIPASCNYVNSCNMPKCTYFNILLCLMPDNFTHHTY